MKDTLKYQLRLAHMDLLNALHNELPEGPVKDMVAAELSTRPYKMPEVNK